MRKQLLSAIMVAGTGIAAAGTWIKEDKLFFHASMSTSRGHCALGYDQDILWTNGPNHNPMSASFSDNTYYTIFREPNPGDWLKTPQALVAHPTNDSIFIGGDYGRIWAGLGDDNNTSTHSTLPHGRTVNDLAFDVYGRLWAATDSMAWRFDGAAWTPAGVAADYGNSPKTTHLAADPRGGVWIGSDGKGLLLYKQGRFQKEFALSVRELQVMPSGTVLVGRYGKAARIPYGASDYEEINYVSYDTHSWTSGIYELNNGTLWVGLFGRIDEQSNNAWTTWIDGSSSASLFYHFLQASDGTLYACGDRATYRYSEKIALPAWPTPDPEFAGSSSSSPSSSSVTPSSSSAVPPSSSSATGGSSSSSSSEREVSSSSSTTTLAHRTEPQGFAMRATTAGVMLHIVNGEVSVALYNSAGAPVRKAITYQAGSYNIPVNDQPTGLYWVRVSRNGERHTLPIVVP